MLRKWSFLVIFTVIMVTGLHSTTPLGGEGLLYVNSARVIPKGYLEYFGGTRFYGKVASFGPGRKAYTLWNVQGFTTFNYGASSHLEMAISPIIYQDTNGDGGNILDGQANLPDDLLLSMKIGSMGAMESPFIFGGVVYTRIPTGQQHNIIYEPYSAGRIEVGMTALVSYFSNIAFPEEGWSLHCNLGYLNHNDVGKELTDDSADPTPKSMSSEVLFGLGLRFPAGTFDFSAEINARHFLVRPPVTAYSREYFSYLTMGVYYKPYRWVTFEAGIDLQFVSGEDLSDYTDTQLPSPPADFPNYPNWRGVLGVKLAILPTHLYSSSEEELIKKRAGERRSILERMMKEQKDTEGAESELTRIRTERKKLEEELERMRKLLEAEKED